jgi:hypothetical protein
MAANLVWEGEIAERIIAATGTREPLWLGRGPERFLALHLLADTPITQGGVILLHDMRGNPDSGNVIHDLRNSLPRRGWETLSIQLPLAARQAGVDEYRRLIPAALPRIQSAVDFLSGRQNRNLILLGHGLGAEMGLAYLSARPDQPIQAFVAITMTADAARDDEDFPPNGLQIPMLDLVGSLDRVAIKHKADLRKAGASRAGWTQYRQDIVTGADHEFRGLAESLHSRVGAWLAKVAAGMETTDRQPLNPPPSTP